MKARHILVSRIAHRGMITIDIQCAHKVQIITRASPDVSLPVAVRKAAAGRDSGPRGILLLLEITKLYAIGPYPPKHANRVAVPSYAVRLEREQNS